MSYWNFEVPIYDTVGYVGIRAPEFWQIIYRSDFER